MKFPIKTLLLALAASFAASASAQSQVSVEGLVDVSLGSVKFSGDKGSTAAVSSGGMTTSWLGFKGVEDLGGGLKADFALTSFLQADTGAAGRFGGDTMFSRDANVGLSGSFGKVSLGRNLAPSFLPVVIFNPFGDSFNLSPLVLHTYVPSGNFAARTWANSAAGDSGWSNEIIYSTPNFSGLSANFHYQFGEKAGDSGSNNVGVNALYFNGPLALTAYYHQVKVSNPLGAAAIIDATAAPINYAAINGQKTWFVGGSYELSVVKLFATYSASKDESTLAGNMDDKTYSLGAKVPVAGGDILLAFADTKRSGSLVGSDLKRDTFSAGYDYPLSKRTDVYAVAMSDKISSADRATSVALGIRHKF
ncbi:MULTISPECIES: porin [unclassified Undibacterium]|uniref:porin n=1 Tax=unclassified Undibacterium TaxID=2630295 RepID=UPI002AC897F7|nr:MULTISPECIES: porin [unclassified Undibacterium]MEB0140784.1 porin [Undibacterium sp. CCC2.1]MEB0173758.1 porin [Undibacterium sp. CCC1.1]MEB0177765.1 porin [Undibacterium sp. CCC3.4]MEB0216965.1 porin [Undibacterium sp. 5I2]WPX44689.1 porin [Undibacterium sp. CCC3.4]